MLSLCSIRYRSATVPVLPGKAISRKSNALRFFSLVVSSLCLLLLFVWFNNTDAAPVKASNDFEDIKINNTLPKIFILGAQKAGSSSLFAFLTKHPLLCDGLHKEPHFFDHDEDYKSGRDGYVKMFPPVAKCAKNISASRYVDGTTVLAASMKAMPRIDQFYNEDEKPLLKFIVLLREPVSRDYSWYQQKTRDAVFSGSSFSDLKTFGETVAYEQSTNNHSHSLLHGQYLEQLEYVVKYFKREQVLILNSGDFFKESAKYMKIVSQFLGISFINAWKKQLPHEDHLDYKRFEVILHCLVQHIPQFDCSSRNQLAEYYKPWNLRLYSWMRKTRHKAHALEPAFSSFDDLYKNVKCVNDSRRAFNKFLGTSAEKSCKKKSRS